jgi:L-fucono-1,5-lactonase
VKKRVTAQFSNMSGRMTSRKTMVEKIDAHHHLWRYDAADYSWIDESKGVLKRDFLPADLERELRAAGMDGAVAVQARQTLSETTWLLELASQFPFIRGVVGWAPIASENFPAELEHLRAYPALKGLRHVIQDEPDENFILSASFNRGIARLKDTGLAYDILIFERHLPAAIQFVDLHPRQTFVLDHMAKPRIRDRAIAPWRPTITELAMRGNVYCKVSGMVTEADWRTWSQEDLSPYLEVVLEAFGPQRLMVGSDWPVCLLATSYTRWFEVLNGLLEKLTVAERERILGGTAKEVYGL